MRFRELFESQHVQYYVRFGEIPENERSGIGASPNALAHMFRRGDQEAGVSVYWASHDDERNMWEIEDVGNAASLDELTAQARDGKRKIYLVTGDLVEEDGEEVMGIDGEPLIHNVRIIKELELKDLYASGLFDGQDDEYESVPMFVAPKMIIFYEDGQTKVETNVDEDISGISQLMGHFDPIKGEYEGKPSLLFRDYSTDSENLKQNPVGSEIAQKGFRLPPGRFLKGRVLIIVNPTFTFKGKPYDPGR